MYRIINFIVRHRNFILYGFLLTVAIALTIQSHSYHRSLFLNSSNWVFGSIYQGADRFSSYFGLRRQNALLVAENQRLRDLLFNQGDSVPALSDSVRHPYGIATARVIKNSYANPKNYITINKGARAGLRPDMAVITPSGILGIVENTSERFAIVQSILNKNSNINAKIKGTEQFGSLVWDGREHNMVQLIDIPRMANMNMGDTIVTGGMSSIFPGGIPIGTIKSYDLNNSNSLYTIQVALFTDMTDLRHVYIVDNADREEIEALQKKTEQP